MYCSPHIDSTQQIFDYFFANLVEQEHFLQRENDSPVSELSIELNIFKIIFMF